MGKNIVLIIGAGANKEINPTIGLGTDLIEDISNRVTDRTSPDKPYLSRLLQNKLGIDYSTRWNFIHHLDHYINNVPNASIDGFLNEVETFPEFVNYKKDFMKIGRTSIIFHIMGWEGSTTVNNIEQYVKVNNNWISIMCNFIEQKKILESNTDINLSIITFNYDRILESFLMKRFNHTAINFIDEKIKHVYGRIGCLEGLKQRQFFDPNTSHPVNEQIIKLNYSNDQIETISELENNINLIYQERNDTIEIQKLVANADQILVMGYGFDDMNNRRLGLYERMKNSSEKLKDKNEVSSIDFKVSIYPLGGKDFTNRRVISEKVRMIYHKADIHYQSCSDFLSECLFPIT